MGYGILRPQLVVWVCVVRLRRHGLLHGFSGGAAARVSTMSLTRYGLMEVVVILVARGSWLHVLVGQGAGWLEIFLHVCSGGAAARLVRGVILVARGSCDW